MLKEKLKNLKSIEPDADFVAGTLRIITAEPQRSALERRVGFIAVLMKRPVFSAAVVLVVLAGLFAYPVFFEEDNRGTLFALDRDILASEARAIDINLDEMERWQSTNQTINRAISEINNTQVNHLDHSLLEREKNNFFDIENIEKDRNQKIEDILNIILL